MAKRESRLLTVTSSHQLTPNMQRIILTGDDLKNFPEGAESDYVKLLFTDNGDAIQDKPDPDAPPVQKPKMRSYSVRAFDLTTLQLTVDFALHADSEGPASTWAVNATPGDRIVTVGPGPVKRADPSADWFLFVGDMTALPAISCNLEQLPANAKGYAVIDIASENDKQTLTKPDGIDVIWNIHDADAQTDAFLNTIYELPWLDGRPFVWSATEFNTMRKLRTFFKSTKAISKDDIYISSYWKAGDSDEQHKAAKKQDAQTGVVSG